MPPQISNVYVNNGLVTAEVFNANSVEIMATTSEYNSKFNSFSMFDDGTNGDLLANDGIYTADLPYQFSGFDVKFYIRSENDDAIKLSPQRAEYEFYTYSYISNVSNIDEGNSRKLIAIKDALGKSVERVANVPLFYIYDDGTVEKEYLLSKSEYKNNFIFTELILLNLKIEKSYLIYFSNFCFWLFQPNPNHSG